MWEALVSALPWAPIQDSHLFLFGQAILVHGQSAELPLTLTEILFVLSLEVVYGPLIIPSGKGEGALEACMNSVHISKAGLFKKCCLSVCFFSLWTWTWIFIKYSLSREGQWENMQGCLLKNYSVNPSWYVHWFYCGILYYYEMRDVSLYFRWLLLKSQPVPWLVWLVLYTQRWQI